MSSTLAAASPGADDRADTPAASRLQAAVSDLPERLLLALMWVGVVVATCTVAQQHRRLVIVPLAVVAVAVTWRWRPEPVRRRRGDAVAVLLCVAFLVTWVAVQVPLAGQRVIVSRDPDVYTLSSLWLVDHASPSVPVPTGSEGSLGFDLARGSLQPQGAHLVPAMSAVVGWVAGTRGVLAANLLWGAAGLLGVFALGRRVVGAGWALLPVAALALSQPVVAFSRAMYSEPLSMAMSMLAGCLLLGAWRSGRSRDFVLCGVALGTIALTRVDGSLVAGGVIASLSLLAALTSTGDTPGRRWSSLLVAAGCLPLLVLSVLDLYLYTGVYFDNSRSSLEVLFALVVVGAVASAVVAWLTVPRDGETGGRWLGAMPVLARRTGVVAGVGLVALWALLTSRPLWPGWAERLQGGGPPMVTALQQAEGLHVDPARTYTELTMAWVSWYIGPVTLGVGLLVLAWWVAVGLRDQRRTALVLVPVLVLPTALLYLVSPQITPDQVWAVRRFVPVVLPGLLIAVAWLLQALVGWGRLPRSAATGIALLAAVGVVAWPVSTLHGLWSVRDKGGALPGVRAVCAQVAGRPAVVSGLDTLLPTVAVVCGVPVYDVVTASPARLAQAYAALGGGDVALVTRDTAGLPPGSTVTPVDIAFTAWEARLLGRPRTELHLGTTIAVGTLDAQGRVTTG